MRKGLRKIGEIKSNVNGTEEKVKSQRRDVENIDGV